jgi:hypothetical protein
MSNYKQNNVTFIQDLPDLDDLEMSGPRPIQAATRTQIKGSRYDDEILPPSESQKYQKFIRPGYTPPPFEAGMDTNSTPGLEELQKMEHIERIDRIERIEDQIIPRTTIMPPGSPSCLEVADHIANCPICSKFYSNDKTVYMIVIAVLSIICILLLKRILDV